MTDSILAILREASAAILDIYADEDRFHIEVKKDQSPLTEADKRANKIICDALADLYPTIPVISEESKQVDYNLRAGYKNFFLVDPLDGTKEFIKRNGEFTVNIAYIEGHRPVGGYVYVPGMDLAYLAHVGMGSWRVGPDNQKVLLKSDPFFLMDHGIKVVASRSHRDERTSKMISRLNEPEIVSIGSSLKFLLIAEGKAHFYPRLAPTMEWDTAAAQCILEEAGGSVIQLDHRSPVIYNKADLTNPYFIAMGALLDPESLQGLLRAVR